MNYITKTLARTVESLLLGHKSTVREIARKTGIDCDIILKWLNLSELPLFVKGAFINGKIHLFLAEKINRAIKAKVITDVQLRLLIKKANLGIEQGQLDEMFNQMLKQTRKANKDANK